MVPAPVFVPASSTGFPIKVYTVPFQALHATYPSNSIPSRSSFEGATSSPVPGHTYVSWNELPEIVRTRLRAKYDSLMSRAWDGRDGSTVVGLTAYTDTLGSSTSMAFDGIVTDDMVTNVPEISDALQSRDQIHNFHELSNLHVFFNPLDAPIDEALAKVEPLFIPSVILHLEDHYVPDLTWSDCYPLSVSVLAFPRRKILDQVKRDFVERTPPNTQHTGPHTLDLLQGLGQHFGFYFAYSPNKTAEEARKSNLSQDLILAAQELGTVMDTASQSREAMSRYATLAQRCFYALYLTRIIVLSKFLECIPRDVDFSFVPPEWALFQHNPPRLSGGDDVFSTVYRHVTRAYGSVFDLKRTAEARFNTLVKKNRCLFPPKKLAFMFPKVPFYLAVDEVEAPILQRPSSGRRPACSRLGVSALFYGFDETY